MTNRLDGNLDFLLGLFLDASELGVLKKAVLSKSCDKAIKKTVLSPKSISGKEVLQAESFYLDNKANHKNIGKNNEKELFELVSGYLQINLYTTLGDCEYKVSKSGNDVLLGGEKLKKAFENASNIGIEPIKRIIPSSNNKKKNYILDGSEPFLKLLEVSDKNGRVYDKKQAKFRQINRFLELVRDVEGHLPEHGVLRICDLCCGKSYLSFAVYHYFSVICGREVKMTGVDLKSDVIEYCSSVAHRLGFDGLEFICGDVSLYDADDKVDMVISLHACDIATDIVLAKAVEWRAKVILSTPCCHHDLNRRLDCRSLDFIADYSMLRQKLCDAATDAMRLKLLEANGYETAALELIDPEETPKNIMLRGIKKHNFDESSDTAKKLMQEYNEIHKFLTGKDSPLSRG